MGARGLKTDLTLNGQEEVEDMVEEYLAHSVQGFLLS
jgi:hypothetical protein